MICSNYIFCTFYCKYLVWLEDKEEDAIEIEPIELLSDIHKHGLINNVYCTVLFFLSAPLERVFQKKFNSVVSITLNC